MGLEFKRAFASERPVVYVLFTMTLRVAFNAKIYFI